MEKKNLVGAWSSWHFGATTEATKVFNETLGKLLGVKYKLVAFATQLVNGTNYAFLCEAETVTVSGDDYIILAIVHTPIKGAPHIDSITVEGPRSGHVIGGWQSWDFSVTPKAKSVFEKAMKPILGVEYRPLAFTGQLVSGTKYCFLAEASPLTIEESPYPALVWIYQPLQGDPHVEAIQAIRP